MKRLTQYAVLKIINDEPVGMMDLSSYIIFDDDDRLDKEQELIKKHKRSGFTIKVVWQDF